MQSWMMTIEVTRTKGLFANEGMHIVCMLVHQRKSWLCTKTFRLDIFLRSKFTARMNRISANISDAPSIISILSSVLEENNCLC